jgi:hypothetical protein
MDLPWVESLMVVPLEYLLMKKPSRQISIEESRANPKL